MAIVTLKIGLIILAYLFGSIPSGLIVGRYFKGINLHEEGSKNIGASNAIRVLGLPLGLLTLLLDAIKSIIVLALVIHFLPNWIDGFNTVFTIKGQPYNYAIIYGLVSVFGHTFSVFLSFGGGKAVASSFAVVTLITPIPGFLSLAVYFLTVALINYASLGSTFAVLTVFIGALIQFLVTKTFNENIITFIAYCLLSLFIFIKHIPNYQRLIKGTETKMYLFKKKKK